MRLIPTAIALSLLAATSSFGQTIEQTEAWQKQDEYMKRPMEIYASQCGAPIQFKFDQGSWWSQKATWTSHSPNGLCGQALEAVATVCGSSATAKKAIGSKIKAMQCGYGKLNQGILAGGVYRITLTGDTANVGDEIAAFIKKSL